jgi:hypothetical protein
VPNHRGPQGGFARIRRRVPRGCCEYNYQRAGACAKAQGVAYVAATPAFRQRHLRSEGVHERVVAGSHRVPSTGAGAKRAQERAELFDGLYAYSGTYTVKGNAVTIHVESAWQPDWVGTEKTRTLKLDHDMLSIVTAPMTSPVDGKTYISTTTFRRVE